jgi:hypothetical protein
MRLRGREGRGDGRRVQCPVWWEGKKGFANADDGEKKRDGGEGRGGKGGNYVLFCGPPGGGGEGPIIFVIIFV